MMAKTPAQRFQNAEELVSVLEGGRSVSFTTDATMAMPSMAGVRLSSAPTTPLPRATGTRPPVGEGVPPTLAGEQPRRSVLSGLLLWLIIVGAVFGGGGFYAYKQGLIFAKGNSGTDPTSAGDTTRLAAADTTKRGDSTRAATPQPPPPPGPGAPGRLVLQNVPTGARISIEGQPVGGRVRNCSNCRNHGEDRCQSPSSSVARRTSRRRPPRCSPS